MERRGRHLKKQTNKSSYPFTEHLINPTYCLYFYALILAFPYSLNEKEIQLWKTLITHHLVRFALGKGAYNLALASH